jgi:uncharacterized protein
MHLHRNSWAIALVLLFSGWISASAAEKLPAAPEKYFNDYAGVVSGATAQRLNTELADFEKQTSNQVIVAIYRTLDTDSSVEDFTQRVAESWRVGQKLHNNGIVLFVFVQARKMRIEVGYGLEGALPDITAKQIITNEIQPAFRAGNYDAGLTAGVHAILQATRGEYKGTGKTRRDASQSGSNWIGLLALGACLLVALWIARRRQASWRNGGPFGGGGISPGGGWYMGGGGWSGGGGGGGWGGGSGGGFSGGGGSFGGGGASGDW